MDNSFMEHSSKQTGMKQIIKTSLLAIAFSFATMISFAQEKHGSSPGWVSDKGFWVVESNIEKPNDHIIRFYTNDNVLVYKETLIGVKLNIERRKVKMKLKKALDETIVAWESKKEPAEELAHVRSILN